MADRRGRNGIIGWREEGKRMSERRSMLTEADLMLLPQELMILRLENLAEAQANIDLDDVIGGRVARAESVPVVRVWRSAHVPGIGVSKKDVTQHAGAAASEQLRRKGTSVVVRQTGGTAVPQGDGVLHLSLLFPRLAQRATTDAYYRLLCDPMVSWFATLGLDATTGALPGSYCDGSYNVLAKGRKLVGTAQAWRGGLAGMASAHPGYVLAHACLMIDVDLPWASAQMNRFYELANDSYRVDLDASANVRELAPGAWYDLSRDEATEQAANSFLDFLVQYYVQLGVTVVADTESRCV